MATGLKNVGNAFAGPSTAKTFQNTAPVIVDDDDDVVFIEPMQVSQTAPAPAARKTGFSVASNENHRADPKSHSSAKDGDSSKGTITETIIIDDEEEPEPARVPEKNASSFSNRRIVDSGRPGADFPSQSTFTRNKPNVGIVNSGITTEPDSEIQIANVTTLDSGLSSVSDSHEGRDMNLMITHVTSLQNPGMGEVSNGLQAPNFGGHAQTFPSPLTSQNKPTTGPYNPGRVNVSSDVFQNGESATHHTSDGWLSQSASFPRNQQPGVDTISPVASLPKQALQQPQPPPPPQQPSKAVKVTCANCKKPLQKGQTAYQRKGSTHLFCSTSCLSSFSQKPAPKKLCTMCKKDITTMKGTIVAQVDSSESFQEFCSTYCLSLYEDKQNSAKNQNKSRCTICGKLTEIRHEVSFKNMTHKLCSDHCFNRYRMANGLIMNCCEHCGEYLPSKGAGSNVLMIDGQWKRFCSPGCLNDFKLKHGKLTSCTGCKAQCRIFDMTQCIGVNGHMEPYCSTTCMNNHKAKFIKPPPPPPPIQTLLPPPNPGIICHFCKRNSLPQYQATMPDGKLYNFCSSECVAKFQTLSIQSSTNGQHVSSDVQLKCNYCKNMFSTKPVTLDWEKKMYQFCSAICCDDYKKLHCIVTFCEYCQEEKTLHDTVKFSGVKKPFCSEGCKLLYKQDFAKRLGLKCVTCNYCFQICKRGSTKEFDGKIRDFCSEECGRKFHDWYYKAARCDCCRTQGTLKEKVQWRGIVKNFCDQQCLLRFYLQQNEPNMTTQKGPENMSLEHGFQAPRPRSMGVNCAAIPQKDMKNKAVLCKPLSMTKATYCKPHMQTKTSQTEEDPNTKYVPVPIPVPVYVPVPMNLYSQKVPAPAVIPVPVPVPVFVPADWDTIKELNEEFKMKELLKENAKVELEEKLKAEMKKQKEFQESLDDEDMREAKRLKLDDHMDEDKQWDALIVEEDEMKDESIKDVDEPMEESLKDADELGEEPLKDKDILKDDLLTDEHEMKEESLKDEEELEESVKEEDDLKEESMKDEEELKEESIKDEDELKEESIKDEDELKEESIKDEDELKEESIKDEDEHKEESIKDEDELKEESIKDEDELKEESIKDEDELKEESIKDEDELKEQSLKDEDEFKGELLKDEDDLKEKSVSKNEGQLKAESLSKAQNELKELSTDKLRADSTKDENELKELSKDDELGKEPSKDDELREDPSKYEDEVREEPSKDEDELREEPSKNDELREEPSKDEDELREEPSKDDDDDEPREESSKDDELREEPSEDELEEISVKVVDDLGEESLENEDELREEPSKDDDDEDVELEEISVKVVDDLGEESLENEDELREAPSPKNEVKLIEKSSLKDGDQLQEESQEEELQEEENRNAEETKEDSLSSGSPFHPIEVLEISDPLDEEDALCGITDEVQEDENCTTDTPSSLPDVPCDLQLDIESDFQSGADELETESPMPPEFGEEYDEQSKPRPLKMGPKRKALWGDCSPPESSECTVSLKYSHGVDAWKHWATTAGEELGETVKLKENLLEHTTGELSILLPRFVREARRPNGDSYAPDSMYYLCLGIQEFLYISERTENLFNDPEYQEFGEELNVILRDWEPSILADGSMFYRVEEEHLWQAKQLGMHSPTTLLFTLLYFNTKYFYLRTVDQHLRLSFGTVLKRWKSNPLTQEKKACLQYQVSSSSESDSEDKITPGKRKHEDDEPVFEQVENTADPSRCPVKTFEYYLSKSPPNLDQRMDVFYLNPESTSSPESLLWFTSTALDAKTLENMLIRVLLVKDIYEENRYELEEDTD